MPAAPLMVAAVSIGLLGVALGRAELVAVLLIGGGIASLALVRGRDGARNPKAVARLDLAKVGSTFVTISGAVLLRFARS